MANELTKKEKLRTMKILEKIYQKANLMRDSVILAQENIDTILRQLIRFNKKMDKSSKTYIEVFHLLLPHIEFYEVGDILRAKLKPEVFMESDKFPYKILDVIESEKEFNFLKNILEDIMFQRKAFILRLSELKIIREQSKSDIVLELLENISSLQFDECSIIEFINLVELKRQNCF